MTQRYEARIGNDGRHYVHGPGDGFGYYSGTMYPNFRCDSETEAKRAAEMCVKAYAAGYAMAREDIRAVLGIDS